ncbi:acyl-CoA dehydrogenase family protein [Parafrankia sp. FMc2]|uniref:acyl-CoA dehydrogenase family protein n=1 Tax=Parafrankia sp. FMc2 TaxID=3233196 RepID=UPI0034D61FCB
MSGCFDLVSLAAAARLPDGTTALGHEDVQAQLATALARVAEVKLIVRDTVDRILVDRELPSDGPVAKLAYPETNVALTELAMQLLCSSTSVDDSGLEVADRWYHNYL